VYAAHSTAHNRGHGDLEVSALCQVTLADEIFASASIDYLRPGSAPTHGDDRVRGVGTEGVIEVAQGAVTLINGEAEGVQHLTPHCDRQIFRDFVVRVTEGRPALIGPEDAFAVTRACLLARQSADEGRVIDF
jgi:predicted dehydrogenase